MRNHLGRCRVDAGGDGDTLLGDVEPQLLDLSIRVCELARQRPRFLSRHRSPPVSAYASSFVAGTPRALARRRRAGSDEFVRAPRSSCEIYGFVSPRLARVSG